MKEQEFDRIIKEKLEAINSAPPADMWGKIASGIPAATPTAPLATSTTISSTIKVILVAASLLIVGGLSYLVSHTKAPIERNKIENTAYSKQEYVIKHVEKERDIAVENKQMQAVEVKKSISNKIAVTKVIASPKKSTATVKKDKETIAFNKQFDSIKTNQGAENKQISQIQDQETTNETPVVKGGEMSFEETTVDIKEAETVLQDLSSEEVVMHETSTIMPNNLIAASKKNEENTSTISMAAAKKDETDEEQKGDEKVELATVPAETMNNPKNRMINKCGIGIHYGPEFLDVDGLKLTDQAVDFSFNYQNYNFILQTGLGVRMSSEQVVYNMKYKRWDYLETQIRFDSAVIVLDQNGKPVLTPVNPYYVEVYDSLNHSCSATAIEQNVMLQFPLLVGYQADFKRFTYFVKGGIRYSLVVYKNTKNLMGVDEQSHLVNMNYASENRAKSNIDYELTFGGAYKLTPNLQIQAEIIGRFYHYSIYEENPPSGIHPWSLSGRIGFVYSLK